MRFNHRYWHMMAVWVQWLRWLATVHYVYISIETLCSWLVLTCVYFWKFHSIIKISIYLSVIWCLFKGHHSSTHLTSFISLEHNNFGWYGVPESIFFSKCLFVGIYLWIRNYLSVHVPTTKKEYVGIFVGSMRVKWRILWRDTTPKVFTHT